MTYTVFVTSSKNIIDYSKMTISLVIRNFYLTNAVTINLLEGN